MPLESELAGKQDALEVERQRELASITSLDEQEARNAAAKQSATAGPLAAASAAAEDLGRTADQPLPPSEAAGLQYTPHKADAQQIQDLSWALLAMGLMGGAASRGNWLGVSSYLNGAMRGFLKGDQLAAQRDWASFQTQFDTAERHDQDALRRLQAVRDNKSLSLNAKMQQYQLLAAEYDMQDVRFAAQIKSHDAVLKQIDARDNALTQARTRLEAVADRVNASQEQRKAPPGFEWDPDKPDELRPIKGGPKDPNSKPWTGREKVFSERIVTSANEAAQAIRNITELPVAASSGVLGVGSSPGHGIYQSTADALRNKLSSQDVQDYNTMLAGVKRNLATIETTGLTPQGALTESFGSLELRAGDSQLTKLRKLAEMRQIVERGIEVQQADPAIPQSIKDVAQKAVDSIKQAVPFTQSDVTRLQREQQKNPKMTLEQLISGEGLGGPAAQPFSDPAKEARYQEWKRTHPNG